VGAFDKQIQAVLEVTRAVIAILSPAALQSPWVRWELSQAAEGGLLVIPVLVDGAQARDLPKALDGSPRLVLGRGEKQAAIRESVVPGILRILEEAAMAGGRAGPSAHVHASEARRRLASAAADVARQADTIKRSLSRIDLKGNGTRTASNTGAAEIVNSPCEISAGMTSLLHTLNVTVAFTSSQAGRLFFLGRNPKGGAVLSQQQFRRPTGLCRAGDGLVLAAYSHVYRLENVVAPGDCFEGAFSHCFIPRTGHYTGILDIHDVAASDSGNVVFANTAYNCVAALSSVHSFRAVWKPSWISEIVSEDRCHLNGVAMDGERPAFVTVVGMSDKADGWREGACDQGAVVDIEENAVICSGLGIPHSPRVHQGQLWLLESGTGLLGFVRLDSTKPGEFTPVALCPGFVRGLDLHGHYAFVGVSRPRHEGFLSCQLERRLADAGLQPWTGVVVVDTRSGQAVEWIRFDHSVHEIYDVAVLPDVFSAISLGFVSHDTPGPITFE
jgi:uncharacterized protein (TIGR03032 family)